MDNHEDETIPQTARPPLSEGLANCPFCGNAPVIAQKKIYDETSDQVIEGSSIQCVNRMCGMQPYTYPCIAVNISLFILNWNDRPNAEFRRGEALACNAGLDPGTTKEKEHATRKGL